MGTHAFTADEARVVLGRRAGRRTWARGARKPAETRTRRTARGRARRRDCGSLHLPVPGRCRCPADAHDQTVATLLPGVEFSTRSAYPDAAVMVRAGISIALATDCNPGTCYSSSMPFVIALAVREMGLRPGQAIYAATAATAEALRR